MTEYRSFRHLPDGTPAPLSCWNSTSPETETFEPEIETRDEVACLELAAVLNVARNRVSIQHRALMAGAIYPFFYEVSLARDTRSLWLSQLAYGHYPRPAGGLSDVPVA